MSTLTEAKANIMTQKVKGRNKYGWKLGNFFNDVDPQKVGEHIEKLEQENGGILEPEKVLNDAKDSNSPLHQCFTWNNSKAGAKWRLHEARMLLNQLTIAVKIEDRPTEEIRGFIHIKTETRKGYASTTEVLNNRELRKQVVQRAFNELKTWRNKYEVYKEFDRVISAIDSIRIK